MNGIDRIGQKVVCIAHIEIVDRRGRAVSGPYPVVDEVYTVGDFVDSGMICHDDTLERELAPGITLLEIATIRGRRIRDGQWIELGWPIICFRPLDERKTDISLLRRVALDACYGVQRKIEEDA